jgi:hypothetical protein
MFFQQLSARHHSLDLRTMKSLLKEDLCMESFVIIQGLFLTPHAQENEEREVPETPQQAEGL